MEEYIKNKYNAFIGQWNPMLILSGYTNDKQYKNDWKSFNDDWCTRRYGELSTKEDIVELQNAVAQSIEMYEEQYNICDQDVFDLFKHMYCYCEGLRKVAQCYGNAHCSFEFDQDEINRMFSDLNQYVDRVEEIYVRLGYQ
ncbi:hypothetical protein [Anaerobium acetethylicum]|uniref:Uncharacterized protein n=1 Tax=Anaerobium acetethylicum TaxID=1619234 RepID=A0A1D3TU70_9FIRM|nr:hypothetical protein [Anaerobium acetethylicum]SCP97522.1 hypothetical protein SAMN05421730_101152 [Anaerobium acetethylicum]